MAGTEINLKLFGAVSRDFPPERNEPITPTMKALLFTLALLPHTAAGITRTFAGGGGNTNWSTTANWSPAAAPVVADSLVFGAGAITSGNNLSGATFHDFIFNSNHTLTGNAFTLTNGITASGAVSIAQNFTLGGDQSFNVTSGSLICPGLVNLNGRQLTSSGAGVMELNGLVLGTGAASKIVKSGPGILRVGFSATLSVAGGLAVGAGTLDVQGGVQTPVTMTGGRITGGGTLAEVIATGGEIEPGAAGLVCGSGLTLGSGVNCRFHLTGPNVETILSVTGGSLALNDATLTVDAVGFTPARGETYQILPKVDAGAITGTFAGLPEGAEIPLGTSIGRLSYIGGTGNDVVITIVSTTRTWDGGNALNDDWNEADNWTGNIAPRFGDVLRFPSGIQSTDRGLDNDFPDNTTFRQLVFAGDDYTVRGNPFQLTHGLNITVPGGTINFDTSVLLALDQAFDFGSTAAATTLHLDLLDNIFTEGHTLTLKGKGRVDGTISGSGGVTIAADADITFDADSNYTGPTLIETGGSLRIFKFDFGGIETHPGSTAGGTRIAGSLLLDTIAQGLNFKIDESLTLLPGGEIHLRGANGAVDTRTELAGTLTLEGAGDVSIGGIDGDAAITGRIQGQGNLTANRDFTIGGSNANTFTGSMTVNAPVILEKSSPGILAVSCAELGVGLDSANPSVLDTLETRQDEQIADNCHVTVGNLGALQIGNVTRRTETIGALTVSETGAVLGPANSLLIVKGTISAVGSGTSGSVALPVRIDGQPCVLDTEAGAAITFAPEGVITRAGAGFLRKTGAGTLTIHRLQVVPVELLAGRTVLRQATTCPVSLNGGRLSSSTDDSAVGEGVGSITSLAGGGTLSPGVFLRKSGPLALNAATTFSCDIANTAGGTGHSRLQVTGTVSLNNATLQLNELAGFNVPQGSNLFILLNDGTDATTGTFAGLPEGTFIPASTAGYTITYKGGDGNDVILARVSTPPVAPKLNTLTFSKGTGPGGQDQVTLAGSAAPSAVFSLEASPDLTAWITLQPVTASSAGVVNVIINQTPGQPKRFFRLRP